MYLLDTDILIDVQRGYSPAVRWFSTLPETPSVPVLVIMELIQDAQDARQVRQAMKLLAPLPVVSLTETDCLHALSNFRLSPLSRIGPAGFLDCRLRREPIRRSLHLQQEALQDDPRSDDRTAIREGTSREVISMKKDEPQNKDGLRPELGLLAELTKRRDLNDIAGTWVPDSAVDQALEDQRRIDPDLWR